MDTLQPGGTHMSEVYRYVPLGPTFSGSSAAPETRYLLTPSVSSYAFRFSKNSTFLGTFFSDFGKISAPNTLMLAKFRSQDLSVYEKIRSVDPTFENPCGTYLTHKKKKKKKCLTCLVITCVHQTCGSVATFSFT